MAYGPQGEIQGLNDERFHALRSPGTDVFMMFDRLNSIAIYHVPSADSVPWWEKSDPMRTLLHWYSLDRPFQLVHAAAVGMNTDGVLLAGRSGSGKSTAALACLQDGLLYAGDDYVAVEAWPRPRVHSLYCSAKIEDGNLNRFEGLRPLVANPQRLCSEKALFFLSSICPLQLRSGFALKAILLPRITGLRETTIGSVRPGESIRAMAPTTLLHLQGGSEIALTKLSSIARAVPNYIIDVGTDLTSIPRAIRAFLRSC
jgi:hypothetical protein